MTTHDDPWDDIWEAASLFVQARRQGLAVRRVVVSGCQMMFGPLVNPGERIAFVLSHGTHDDYILVRDQE